MKKIVALLTIFLSTLFITSNLNASSFELNNDNNYLTKNLLISYGGVGGKGGGGKNAAKGRAKEKAKLLFKKRRAAKKVSEGIPLTEEEKKILYVDEVADKKNQENTFSNEQANMIKFLLI